MIYLQSRDKTLPNPVDCFWRFLGTLQSNYIWDVNLWSFTTTLEFQSEAIADSDLTGISEVAKKRLMQKYGYININYLYIISDVYIN